MKETIYHKNVPFTMIANSVFSDPSLSLKAKGLFGYIYSKPDDWDFAADRIANECSDGVDSVQATLKELQDAGYLVRQRKPNGKMAYYATYQPKREIPFQVNSLKGKIPSISKTDINTKTEEESKRTAEASSASWKNDVKTFFNKADDVGIAMTREEFVLMCRGSSQANIRLLGEYADERKIGNATRGQWRQFGVRNMKSAKRLAPYTERQLAKAMALMEKDLKENGGFITKWGLETLEKYIDLV
jgi:hypothetical protein